MRRATPIGSSGESARAVAAATTAPAAPIHTALIVVVQTSSRSVMPSAASVGDSVPSSESWRRRACQSSSAVARAVRTENPTRASVSTSVALPMSATASTLKPTSTLRSTSTWSEPTTPATARWRCGRSTAPGRRRTITPTP